MTAKLILSMDGVVINEYPINKERMTIGRKAHNDVILDNLAVSGEHAAIVTILNDSFLEDLDSTNGLEVNGVVVKKHFMQPNDIIGIGKYHIKYINDQASQTAPADFEKTMILRAPVKPATGTEAAEKTGKFGIPSAATAQVVVPANTAATPAAAPGRLNDEDVAQLGFRGRQFSAVATFQTGSRLGKGERVKADSYRLASGF